MVIKNSLQSFLTSPFDDIRFRTKYLNNKSLSKKKTIIERLGFFKEPGTIDKVKITTVAKDYEYIYGGELIKTDHNFYIAAQTFGTRKML